MMKNRSGLTFLEIILALGLGTVIVFVVSQFASTITGLEDLVNNQLTAQQDLAQVMQVMTTEIRSASPSELGAYPIAAAESSSFMFYSDIDRDGLIDRVHYFFGTSTMQKGVVEPTGVPLTYVTSSEVVIPVITGLRPASSSFLFFGEAATSTDSPLVEPITLSDIRFVRASVTAEASTSSQQTATYSQAVTIRNLRSN